MKQRLINKADLMDKIEILYDINGCKLFAVRTESINQLPTVEPIKGEWQTKTVRGQETLCCSNCGADSGLTYEQNFCPNCGADMRGDKE